MRSDGYRSYRGYEYYIDFVYEYPDGTSKRIRQPAKIQTQKDCLREIDALKRAELERYNAGQHLRDDAPLIKDLKDRFLADSRRVNGNRWPIDQEATWDNWIIPLLGDKRIDAIGDEDITAFDAAIEANGNAAGTINKHLRVLKHLFRMARDEWKDAKSKKPLISSYPKIKMRRANREPFAPISQDEFLTFEEYDALLSAPLGPLAAMIIIAGETGLRIGELQALKWDNVLLVRRTVLVRETGSRIKGVWVEDVPKGKKTREVPMTDRAFETFSTMVRFVGSRYVFFHPETGGPQHYNTLYERLRALGKKAGLPKLKGWHVLRHTFASHLAMMGVDLRTIQKYMGHSSIAVTEIYAKLSTAHTDQAIKALDRRRAPVAAEAL